MKQSCLVKNFSHYGPLSESDVRYLQGLEEDPVFYPAGSSVITQGSDPASLFVVKEGWCLSMHQLQDGSRQILDVSTAGDVVGMREVAFDCSISGLQTLTDSYLCKFPKDQLPRLFSRSSHLTSLFFLISMRREAMLTYRIVNLGRREARERICHFIAELKHRLDQVHNVDYLEFDFPFKPPLLADILGLSTVHVYRTLAALREDGLVEVDGGHLVIHDLEALEACADFQEEYLSLDLDWFPGYPDLDDDKIWSRD